jgi:crossover junction endodeoxyribonuclease RuvC
MMNEPEFVGSGIKLVEKSQKPIFVGLDLSLTSTGFCLKQGDKIEIDTVKTVPKNFNTDLDRLIHIRGILMGKIPNNVKMVCVEDFFTPSNSSMIGSAINLAMLGTAIRMALHERGISFVIISPSQLKKFVTGKGIGDKSMILKEVYKRWGIEAKDDNQADATVLAYFAEALVDGYTDQTPQFQVDVIKTVRKDRPRYNVKEAWAVKE